MLAENERRPRRRLAPWICAIGVLTIWGVGWLTYTDIVELSTCLLGHAHGGRIHSDGWAGGSGLLLVVLTVLLAFRWRRRLLPLAVCFLLVYVAGLVMLWEVSPAIWGPTACTGGSF